MSLVTPKQIAKTINLVAESGIDSAQYQALLESGRFPALLREFMEEGSGPEHSEPTSETYTVVVDYDKSLVDMIEAGKYDWVNDNITAERFPVNKRESGEVELHVVHFGRCMTTREVLAELDRRSLRPAELPELLALGAAQPDLQRKYLLVALGSGWQDPRGTVSVPILSECDDERDLDLDWRDSVFGWSGDCRFVAVSK